MKSRHLNKQSGVALMAVMFVIVLAMVVLPSIMTRSSFVQGLGAKQVFQMKNTVKAEEINNMLHAVAVSQAITDVDAGFSSTTDVFKCESRVISLGDCQTTRSKKIIATDSVEVFRCRSSSSNTQEVKRMQHVACVYAPGYKDVAISVWSYIQGAEKYVKVREESF